MKFIPIVLFGLTAISGIAEADTLHDRQRGNSAVSHKNLKVQKVERRVVRAQPASSERLISMGWDWDSSARNIPTDQDVTELSDKPNAPPLTGSGGKQPAIAAVAPPKVAFPNSYGAGSIVIDTAGRHLYYVLSASSAYSYPIAVGKQGFAWSGTEKISRKVAWPDWIPPVEMRARQPGLPQRMAGGIRNPLGAMALYLGNTLYRIHGTNDVNSIGTASSSGCIRMTNGSITHLAGLAGVGTTVHVLKALPEGIARAARAPESTG